jgi:type VI secretion system protein ImpJ
VFQEEAGHDHRGPLHFHHVQDALPLLISQPGHHPGQQDGLLGRRRVDLVDHDHVPGGGEGMVGPDRSLGHGPDDLVAAFELSSRHIPASPIIGLEPSRLPPRLANLPEVCVKLLSPLVWHEGMHLSQHHFQAQARYFEDLTSFTLSHLSPGPWGLLELRLDEGALRGGTAAILHARGVLPDGTPFNVPQEPPPPPLPFSEQFSPTAESQLLYLALPSFDPERANCAVPGERPGGPVGRNGLRYSPATEQVVDLVSGGEPRPVSLASKNFRLLLEGMDLSGLDLLPIARIRRDGAGHFVSDPDHVPPALQIGASQRLLDLLGRMVAMLEAKAEALRGERVQGGGSGGELARAWQAHAVHSALPSLRHLLRTRGSHPEHLFREMARLAGALCTFSLESDPGTLPIYDHGEPGPGFLALERHIHQHLELVLPSGALNIPLVAAAPSGSGKDEVLVAAQPAPGSPTFHLGTVRDTRMFGAAEWFLGVRSSAPAPVVSSQVPELVKICAARFVPRLVREALPGLGVAFVPSPPSEVGARSDAVYFRILRTEPCWTAIVKGGEVGIYVPASIPDAALTLTVVPST